jgi:non-ribosomal peptide synthetase component E (peptide arylation enzyme)
MREAVIASTTARTPIGRASRGAFNDTEGQELAAHAISHACAARDSRGGEMADVIVRPALPQGSTGGPMSSLEVEYALGTAPGIADAAVLGVPDDVMGEKVGAIVVGADDGAVEMVALVEHCRTHLADFEVPHYVAVMPAGLPPNAGGRILKAKLRDEVQWGKPLR